LCCVFFCGSCCDCCDSRIVPEENLDGNMNTTERKVHQQKLITVKWRCLHSTGYCGWKWTISASGWVWGSLLSEGRWRICKFFKHLASFFSSTTNKRLNHGNGAIVRMIPSHLRICYCLHLSYFYVML
jgi:hypothetical protein